jgi:hypothetical protein
MRIGGILALVALVGCKGDGEIDVGEDTDSQAQVGNMLVSPTSIDLGTIFVGSSATADITIENVGNGEVDIRLEIVGGKADVYVLSSYTASPEPDAESVHTLSLTPTTWGDHSVSVLIDDQLDEEGAVEVTVKAAVQVDADGDGYGSVESGGGDCDDANNQINPGATETWYDAVDSDCAGDDDFDQDHDGVRVDTDCDDTDAATFPGAADAWYDGADSDCAGNSDYDQDGDGYDASAYGGADCDDLNEAISPAADETWYDGIDADCDGANDYDQDGDGSNLGVDCDDTNGRAYPGADEIWYDDVDEACDGGDDWDQDGDGTPYPTDCNDTDPTTTGPTTEVLDGMDNDCNGVADDFVITSIDSGAIYGTASNDYLGYEYTIAMGGDTTGSGGDDLHLGAPYSGSVTGGAWVVAGTAAATAAGSVANYDTAVSTGNYYQGRNNGVMGDLDADGDADWVVTTTTDTNQGYAYVWDGPTSGSLTTAGAAASFTGTDVDQIATAAVGDVDGDGVDDLMVGASGYNESEGSRNEGLLAFYAGGTSFAGTYDLTSDSDDAIVGDADSDEFARTMGVGDLDGDGYVDVFAGAPGSDDINSGGGAVYVFMGNSGMSFDDYAADASEIVIGGSSGYGLGSDGAPVAGDLDGDGELDLAVGEDEAAGDLWIYASAGSLSGELDSGDATYTITGDTDEFASSWAWTDLDGDGDDDLVVGADEDDNGGTDAGAVYVFMWSAGWASSLTTSNANGRYLGATAYDYAGTEVEGGADLDGDGTDDLVVGAPGNDTNGSSAGAAYVILGW